MRELGFALFLLTGVGGGILAFRWAVRDGLGQRPLTTGLLAGYAAIYGLIPLGAVDLVLPRTYARAGLTAFAGICGFIAAHSLIEQRRAAPQSALGNPAQRVERRVIRIGGAAAAIAAAGFLLTVYAATTSIEAFLAAGRLGFRGTARSPVLMLVGTMLLRALMIPAFAFAASAQRQLRTASFVGSPLFALAVWLAFDGTRSLAIGIVGAMMLGYISGSQRRSGKLSIKGRTLRTAGAIAAAGTVALLAISLYDARTTLQREGVESLARAIGELEVRPAELAESEPLAYGQFLYTAVEMFPEHEDFRWFAPLRRTVFFFLPTGGLKPPDLNNEFAQLFPRLDPTTTLPPTLPGEGYISAGGIAGAFLWLGMYGVLSTWLDRRALHSPTFYLLVGAAAVETVVLGLRGQLYEQAIRTASLGFIAFGCWIAARVRVSDRALVTRHPVHSP